MVSPLCCVVCLAVAWGEVASLLRLLGAAGVRFGCTDSLKRRAFWRQIFCCSLAALPLLQRLHGCVDLNRAGRPSND